MAARYLQLKGQRSEWDRMWRNLACKLVARSLSWSRVMDCPALGPLLCSFPPIHCKGFYPGLVGDVHWYAQESGIAAHAGSQHLGRKSGHNDSRDFWRFTDIPVVPFINYCDVYLAATVDVLSTSVNWLLLGIIDTPLLNLLGEKIWGNAGSVCPSEG